jgi:hypothetical protein
MGLLQDELLQLFDTRDAEAAIIPQHTLLINQKPRHFFTFHPALNSFNALMSFLSFLDLVKESRSDLKFG